MPQLRARPIAALVSVLLPLANAAAQTLPAGACRPGVSPADGMSYSADACLKMVDLFAYMVPQFETASAGGNVILGKGNVTGAPGRLTLELRLAGVAGATPRMQDDAVLPGRSPVVSEYQTDAQVLVVPTVAAAVGVLAPTMLGPLRFGGLDILGALSIAAQSNVGSTKAGGEGKGGAGYGVRVGVFRELPYFPGVSVSWMRRRFSAGDLTTTSGEADMTVRRVTARSHSLRAVASKSIARLGVAVGVGQDALISTGSAELYLQPTRAATVRRSEAVRKATNRRTIFVDLAYDVAPTIKVVGEWGHMSGGRVTTYNQFDRAPDSANGFLSLGLRVGR
jgi:hypothetical protein